jgi:dynein heavy chain, axonemal
VPLFSGVLIDLFPGVSLPEADHANVISRVKVVCHETNLQPLDAFISKIIQLYEMIIVWHG